MEDNYAQSDGSDDDSWSDGSRSRARVIGQHGDDWIVQDRQTNQQLLLAVSLKNSVANGTQPYMMCEIKVHSHIRKKDEEYDRVTAFSCSADEPTTFTRILVLTKVDNLSVDVLGTGCRTPLTVTTAQQSRGHFLEHNFVIAKCQFIPCYYVKHTDKDRYWFTEDKVKRRQYDQRPKKKNRRGDDDMTEDEVAGRMLHVIVVQPVKDRSLEFDLISTWCIGMQHRTAEHADIYIRDPFVARARLEELLNNEAAEALTIETSIEWSTIKDVFQVTITLSESEAWLTKPRSIAKRNNTGDKDKTVKSAWYVGAELQLRHPLLCQNGTDHVVLLAITGIHKMLDRTVVITAKVEPVSLELFKVVSRTNTQLHTRKCRVGPQSRTVYSSASIIERCFKNFHHYDFFETWIGRMKPAEESDDRISESFIPLPLDRDQRAALKSAANVGGFHCITAPGGTGKTRIAATLINICNQRDGDRFAVCAPTNVAVENVMELLDREFPHLKVCREFSKKATNDSSQESLTISLREMSKHPGDYLKLSDYPKLVQAHREFEQARAVLDESQVTTLEAGLIRLEALQAAEKTLRNVFLECYAPGVLGATPVMFSRRLNSDIGRLVIEEAGQMSIIEMVAIYCQMPHLHSVTLLGDQTQLPPGGDSTVRYGSQAARFLSPRGLEKEKGKPKSELERVRWLEKADKNTLKTVYRTHPAMVKTFMSYFYDGLRSGWNNDDTLKHAILEKSLRLPLSESRQPFLFIDLKEAVEELDGTNVDECYKAVELVMKAIDGGADGNNIHIVCFHRAQLSFVKEVLKGRGNIGSLKLPCHLNTVDSYQGKECQVVILLTTKVCSKSALGFVSNLQRCAVAFSRARNFLYVLGNFRKLAESEIWKTFVYKCIGQKALVDDFFKPITAEEFEIDVIHEDDYDSQRFRRFLEPY